jgi:hypothetical protein
MATSFPNQDRATEIIRDWAAELDCSASWGAVEEKLHEIARQRASKKLFGNSGATWDEVSGQRRKLLRNS